MVETLSLTNQEEVSSLHESFVSYPSLHCYSHYSLVPTRVLFVLLKFIIYKGCIIIQLVKIFRNTKYFMVHGCNNSSEWKVCKYLKLNLNDLLVAHSSYFTPLRMTLDL